MKSYLWSKKSATTDGKAGGGLKGDGTKLHNENLNAGWASLSAFAAARSSLVRHMGFVLSVGADGGVPLTKIAGAPSAPAPSDTSGQARNTMPTTTAAAPSTSGT